MGVGTQAGAEVTDFLIVLNTRAALVSFFVSRGSRISAHTRVQKTFMSAGSFTIGGNLSIAVGPLGRNGEAIGSLSSAGTVAAMYSYSKTKGLFGGVSLEGSVIVERQDANAIAYGNTISVKALLSGAVPPPTWAQPFIATLENCTGMPGGHTWVHDTPADLSPAIERGDPFLPTRDYAFGGVASPGSVTPGGGAKKKKMSFPPMSWGRTKSTGSYFEPNASDADTDMYNSDSRPSMGHRRPSKSDDLSRSMQKLAFENAAAAKSPQPPQLTSFDTHFDSDFVSESSAPPRAPTYTGDTFGGLDPSLSSTARGGRTEPEPDLLDFGPDAHGSSPLDFDPLGPSSRRMQPSAGTSAYPSTMSPGMMAASPNSSRPPLSQASSNPFFGLDSFKPSTPPTASTSNGFTPPKPSYGQRAWSASPASGVRTSSPFSDPSMRQSPLSGVRQNQQNMFGDAPSDPESEDDLYTPRRTRPPSSFPAPKVAVRPELAAPLPAWAKGRAIALFDFAAAQSGDLGFKSGQVITIMEMDDNTDTWLDDFQPVTNVNAEITLAGGRGQSMGGRVFSRLTLSSWYEDCGVGLVICTLGHVLCVVVMLACNATVWQRNVTTKALRGGLSAALDF
jgi:hypothetical protein